MCAQCNRKVLIHRRSSFELLPMHVGVREGLGDAHLMNIRILETLHRLYDIT